MNSSKDPNDNNQVVQSQSSGLSSVSGAQKTTSDTTSTSSKKKAVVSVTPAGKEHESVEVVSKEVVGQISKEVEIPEEVEKAGVTTVKETIELPPDIKKLGVSHGGASTPVASTTALPQVSLPISDQKVIAGLHGQIFSSLRWLAVWCMRKLQKAHIALKVVHKKIIRVKT